MTLMDKVKDAVSGNKNNDSNDSYNSSSSRTQGSSGYGNDSLGDCKLAMLSPTTIHTYRHAYKHTYQYLRWIREYFTVSTLPHRHVFHCITSKLTTSSSFWDGNGRRKFGA